MQKWHGRNCGLADSLRWQSIEIAFSFVREQDGSVVREKIAAEPTLAGWRDDAAQHREITSIVDLPVFSANDQHGALVLGTAVQTDRIETSNLKWSTHTHTPVMKWTILHDREGAR